MVARRRNQFFIERKRFLRGVKIPLKVRFLKYWVMCLVLSSNSEFFLRNFRVYFDFTRSFSVTMTTLKFNSLETFCEDQDRSQIISPNLWETFDWWIRFDPKDDLRSKILSIDYALLQKRWAKMDQWLSTFPRQNMWNGIAQLCRCKRLYWRWPAIT